MRGRSTQFDNFDLSQQHSTALGTATLHINFQSLAPKEATDLTVVNEN